ncbi:Pentatricopeptide repeat [Macleaya cordata]|uniref:Pentatricopeptide repeat n=1 Tax=Macleaya cordata TaxID=56857 RepID=A0A200QIJ9_MACCD|nr:Pentatricopeptide repeat [Macleaya cordata]
MSIYQTLIRSLRCSSLLPPSSFAATGRSFSRRFSSAEEAASEETEAEAEAETETETEDEEAEETPSQPPPVRSYGFSSAEEAAAERRRRKRRLRIEPPLHALGRGPSAPRPRPDPNAPRLPDSTSALVGNRLNLHNRVQSLIRSGDLYAASAIARQAVFSNTRPTVFTCNAVIASMYRAGRHNDVANLFRFFFNQCNIIPNIVSYNNLINAYCDAGCVDVALDVYGYILSNSPFSPSPITYRHLTKGLVDSDRISEATDLLREMLNKGHGADSLVYNNLILGFLELGNLDRALEFLNELRERCIVYDGVVHATFMDWYFKNGREKEAMESYQDLLDRQFKMTPATCNVLLEVLLKYGKSLEAETLFDDMLNSHKPPNTHAVNSDTYSIMVNECFKLGKILEAMAVFRRTGTKQGSKPFAMDAACFNNIMGKLCENGLVSDAEKLFGEMSTKSVMQEFTTFKIFIEVYLKEDRVDDAIQMFKKMLFETSLRPGMGFCDKVFDELIKNGRLEEASDIIGRMGEKNVKPDPTSYEVVIMGLKEAGRLDRIRDLLDQMVKNNIAFTPTLRSFLDEAFGK